MLNAAGTAALSTGCEALMDWTSDNRGQTYTVRQDSCQGLVWRTRAGEWRALVSWEGSAAGHANFPTLKDAQAWCEAQVAELITINRCAP